MWLCVVVLVAATVSCSRAFSDLNPHHFPSGILKPFTGLPLSYSLTAQEKKLLSKGKSVIMRDDGSVTVATSSSARKRNGRAKIIQDIAAPPNLCLEKILDFDNYTRMVSLLKKFDIYNQYSFNNGTQVTCAKFEVGVLTLRLGYFLKQVYRPQHNTLTWTLDYSRDSDFDDNVGHWQVMTHPDKENWSRVLYSIEAVLPEWLPNFALGFIEKAALVESTGWLKRESEKAFKNSMRGSKKISSPTKSSFVDVPHTYIEDTVTGGVHYTPIPPRSNEVDDTIVHEERKSIIANNQMNDQETCAVTADAECASGDNSISPMRTQQPENNNDKVKKMPSMSTLLKHKKINKIRIRHVNVLTSRND